MRGDNLFSDEITHTELIELDNDLKVMRHKADYMQEKLYKEIYGNTIIQNCMRVKI